MQLDEIYSDPKERQFFADSIAGFNAKFVHQGERLIIRTRHGHNYQIEKGRWRAIGNIKLDRSRHTNGDWVTGHDSLLALLAQGGV